MDWRIPSSSGLPENVLLLGVVVELEEHAGDGHREILDLGVWNVIVVLESVHIFASEREALLKMFINIQIHRILPLLSLIHI